ncbi:MAG: hypothetical protein GEU79_10135 [Acidimicrobiia bacterium]|nr:hypothetical protein [Acidimicrobiia bacterium]
MLWRVGCIRRKPGPPGRLPPSNSTERSPRLRKDTLIGISDDRQQVLRLIEAEGAQVVDVLPQREYYGSHLPDAVSIALKQLTADTASTLSRHKPVVVSCHDGL